MQFLLLALFALILQAIVVVSIPTDDELQAKIELEREAIAEHRKKLDNHVNELKRLSDERMRSVLGRTQQNIERAKNMQDDLTKTTQSGSYKSKKTEHDMHEEQERLRQTQDRIEKSKKASKNDRHTRGDIHSVLTRHSVSEEMVDDISRMAKASIPRESIIQHIKQHYPDKRPDEWNDIVVAAMGKRQQVIEPMDTDHAHQVSMENKKRRFEQAKTSFQQRHPEHDL